MEPFSARSFWLPVMVATMVAALFGAVLGRRGRHLEGMLVRGEALATRSAQLRQENEHAQAERNALLSSPAAIERVAREEYGFAAPGEKVVEYGSGRPRSSPVPRAELQVSEWQKVLTWRPLPFALPAAVFVLTALAFAVWHSACPPPREATPSETARGRHGRLPG
ncbi:MAG: FtsB family cell division protein [Planctomycetota bacterium]|jgi:cell division protein FtsB